MHSRCTSNSITHREEHLMVELRVVVIVVVVQITPPGIVVREDGGEEEQDHVPANPPLNHQLEEILIAFVEQDDSAHDQNPYLEAVPGRIEVHVLVRGDSALVCAFEDRVPAGARAESLVHGARVCVPEVPQNENVKWHNSSGHYGTAENPQPGVRDKHLAKRNKPWERDDGLDSLRGNSICLPLSLTHRVKSIVKSRQIFLFSN